MFYSNGISVKFQNIGIAKYVPFEIKIKSDQIRFLEENDLW